MVMLFSVVVAAGLGMVVWNASQRPMTPEEMEKHAAEDKAKEAKPAESKRQEAAEMLSSALPSKKADKVKPGGPVPFEDEAPKGNEMAKKPTIFLDEYVPAKPLFNDATIATQWYRENSRSAKRAEENARERGQ